MSARDRTSSGDATPQGVQARLKWLQDTQGVEFIRILCGRAHPCPGLLGEADRYLLVANDDERFWNSDHDNDPPIVHMSDVNRFGPTWVVAMPPPLPLDVPDKPDPVRRASDYRYRGYADSGYRVLRPNRRHGRRPKLVTEIVGPTSTLRIAPLEIAGQQLTLPCRIFCPVCGTPNDVPDPEAIQDS